MKNKKIFTLGPAMLAVKKTFSAQYMYWCKSVYMQFTKINFNFLRVQIHQYLNNVTANVYGGVGK